MLQKFAPFVGPLFGRTCWTCPNPPLVPMGSVYRAPVFTGRVDKKHCMTMGEVKFG